MYLINFLNSITNSDVVFYVLISLLAVISVAMFYLLYVQNKEIKRQLTNVTNYNDNKKVNKPKPFSIKEIVSLDENRPELLEVTDLDIPDKLELTQSINISPEAEFLYDLSKELEKLPKDKRVNLTPYEEEQEEKAIISYDELVERAKETSIAYSDTKYSEDQEVEVKQIDLEKTGKIELDPIKRELNGRVTLSSYEHEEAFLNALKELENILNS